MDRKAVTEMGEKSSTEPKPSEGQRSERLQQKLRADRINVALGPGFGNPSFDLFTQGSSSAVVPPRHDTTNGLSSSSLPTGLSHHGMSIIPSEPRRGNRKRTRPEAEEPTDRLAQDGPRAKIRVSALNPMGRLSDVEINAKAVTHTFGRGGKDHALRPGEECEATCRNAVRYLPPNGAASQVGSASHDCSANAIGRCAVALLGKRILQRRSTTSEI